MLDLVVHSDLSVSFVRKNNNECLFEVYQDGFTWAIADRKCEILVRKDTRQEALKFVSDWLLVEV